MKQSLKRRLLAELLILGVLTIIFLVVFPKRSIYVDGLLATIALSLIVWNPRFTKNSVWGQFPLRDDLRTRVRRSYTLAGAFTILVVLAFAATGFTLGYRAFVLSKEILVRGSSAGIEVLGLQVALSLQNWL